MADEAAAGPNSAALTPPPSATLPPNEAPDAGPMARRSKALLKRYRHNKSRRQALSEQLFGASQYTLMRLKFKKHRVAMASLWLLGFMYLVAIFAEFFAPYSTEQRFSSAIYASPTAWHVFDASTGSLTWPYFDTVRSRVDPLTFRYESKVVPGAPANHIALFAASEPYKLMGFLPMSRHLFGSDSAQPLFLLGADNLGRDLFSRIIYASRVSLFVGFGGVFVSFALGIVLGGISGFLGGMVDLLVQRVIELVVSIPQIPLWMALAASFPPNWTGIQKYFAITIVLSLVSWTGLARVVRGRILSMREEDYVTAARVSSAGTMAIIMRHLLPGFTSYLIVNLTIAIPFMILGETTLSFLGLGIRPPDVSWGTLLQQAQDVVVISNYPWILLPAAFVVGAVILFNFIGDGLRDAADPYTR